MKKTKMDPYSVFIGTWNTSGEVYATDFSPATKLIATDTYRWLPGRHFIVHEIDARFGGDVSRSLEIVGYDSSRKKFLSRSFDDSGSTDEFEVSLKGRRWRIFGNVMRFDGGFSADKNELTGLWEIKGRSGWQPWIKLQLVRS